jgi:predicted dehydrogenase
MNRRTFLRNTSRFTAALAALAHLPCIRAAQSPHSNVVLGIIGCNGRGMDHIAAFSAVPGVEIGYVCDVDSRAVDKGIAAVAKKQARKPEGVRDLRRLLEARDLDAVAIATPDHWHTPATILACAAGKHVYVEKPGSHNARESRWIVSAARKHRRVVQMGNQRRSWPWVVEAMQALHQGEVGPVRFARAWYTNRRGTIGRGKPAPVPDWLDYSLWQGPAPERPYQDNLIHYNWHWFWNWGTGELGNNGVHALDLARWGLQVEAPRRITCGGNRYFFQDDWESPDTCIVTFDFGDKGIAWEGQSCAPRGFEGTGFGVTFFGDNGSLVIAGTEAKVFDLKDKLVRTIKSPHDDVTHFVNFVDGIRNGTRLNSEIEEGQKATLLCHLGNIAWRSGRTVDFDPVKHSLVGDRSVRKFWGRDYRKGWEPKV